MKTISKEQYQKVCTNYQSFMQDLLLFFINERKQNNNKYLENVVKNVVSLIKKNKLQGVFQDD